MVFLLPLSVTLPLTSAVLSVWRTRWLPLPSWLWVPVFQVCWGEPLWKGLEVVTGDCNVHFLGNYSSEGYGYTKSVPLVTTRAWIWLHIHLICRSSFQGRIKITSIFTLRKKKLLFESVFAPFNFRFFFMSICFLWGMPTWRAYVSDKRGPFSFFFLYLFSWVPEVGNHVSCPGISLTVCGILWSYSFHNNFLLPLYPLHSLPPPLSTSALDGHVRLNVAWNEAFHIYTFESLFYHFPKTKLLQICSFFRFLFS